MPDIVTITINPAIDVSTTVGRVEPVRKLRCSRERRDPGGGGINVARVVQRLGGDVMAYYPCGGVTGQLFEQLVEAEHVRSVSIPIAGETREDFTIVELDTGREFRFVLPGPELSEREWRACLAAFESRTAQARHVVLSGSLAPGAPPDLYAKFAAVAKAKGARVVLDASGPALAAALTEGVYLVKPNLRELEELTGAEIPDRQSQIAAARDLIATGRAEMVALTLGRDGALLVTSERAWFADALAIEAQSTVGAGDSFLGALVWALDAGVKTEEAFRYGVAGGSAALLAPGTELCRRADLEALLGRVRVQAV